MRLVTERRRALADVGRLDEAQEVFSQVITIRSTEAAAYFERGKVNGRLGKVKQALADFLKVTELRPDDPDGYTFLGWALLDAGQGGMAEPVFIRALQLNANNPKAMAGLRRARELLAVESLFKAASNRPTTKAGQQ